MTKQERWIKLVAAIEKDIPGFRVGYKTESRFQKLLGKISFFNDYMGFTTTMYPVVWFRDEAYVQKYLPCNTLEHEWVHIKDATTFYGWLPFLPARLNALLFNLTYILVLPWPGIFRAYAEFRAYRRSIELGEKLESRVETFTGSDYFFMWPFPNHVRKMLDKPSPYKELMDSYRDEE